MKVLVIGSGGRDHTIAWKFKQSDRVKELYVAHGNAGIGQTAQLVNARTVEEYFEFAKKERIDLTFVGPESSLSAGIVDMFVDAGLNIVGPTRAAARLEYSKCDAKEIMRDLGVPVADFAIFDDPYEAKDYVKSVDYQVVVKADGLAAGKGSLVCDTVEDAEDAVHLIMEKKRFKESGNRVVVEKRLFGRELSFFCFADGKTVVPMVAAQDYKRARDFDEGKNTGGMGSYSPHPWLGAGMVESIMDRVVRPLITGYTEKYGVEYKGILYVGLMLVEEADGINPYVLEINIRHGDPEAQVILPRMNNDIVDVSEAVINGTLDSIDVTWDPEYRLCLIAVSGRVRGKKGWYKGYPGRYRIGQEITGLDKVDPEVLIFHSGTAWRDDALITTGGRVLCLVTKAPTLAEARDRAYQEMEKVQFEGIYYRTDIGKE